MNSSPIGVFDSGVGGVSVLQEIRRRLPNENLLYCADSGYAPYGPRSVEYVRERSLKICHFLISQGSKALVIACNTATAGAAGVLRERWPDVPILGMEPAVKPATVATKTRVVGVLATVGTLVSTKFAALLDTFGRSVHVVAQPGTGLVECVERGDLYSETTRELLAHHLGPLLDANADVIVLGCTHYVFLRDLAQEIVGPNVRIIDTGAAVAAHLDHRLEDFDLLTDSTTPGTECFWTSGNLARAEETLKVLWSVKTQVLALPEDMPGDAPTG